MSSVSIEAAKATATSAKEQAQWALLRDYWPFVVPALIVIAAVIVFPWVFTLWMSANSWTLGQAQAFSGWDNYLRLATDTRFWHSLWHTVLYTVLAVIGPLFLGTLAALIFDAQFPLRGRPARHIRHADDGDACCHRARLDDDVSSAARRPQLSSLIGRHRACRNGSTIRRASFPSLVLVETWQWTPLIMLIVLGGLAAAAARAV